MAEFKVVEYHDDAEWDGWRMAAVYEVEQNMGCVQECLADYEWHICALVDGTVSGPGYSFEITHDVKELGHKLLIKTGIELRVVEYDHCPEEGWRVAKVEELLEDWDNLTLLLGEDYEWHICALLDGTVGGPGYNHDLKFKHEPLGHKILINRPDIPVEFQVVEYEAEHEPGWKYARVGDVYCHMDQVKDIMADLEWHICALSNGTVAGPGYNFEITGDVKALGHKLIMKGGAPVKRLRFMVENNEDEIFNHWRIARVAEVKQHIEKVKAFMGDHFEWHICALVDGRVSGPGYGYEISTEGGEQLGHKLCISH